jgi:hypothetical protein
MQYYAIYISFFFPLLTPLPASFIFHIFFFVPENTMGKAWPGLAWLGGEGGRIEKRAGYLVPSTLLDFTLLYFTYLAERARGDGINTASYIHTVHDYL